MGTALQVFHNLGILESTVESVLENARNSLRTNLRKALNIEQLSQLSTSSSSSNLQGNETRFKGPGRVSMPVTGSSPAFRSALWSNMEKLMDQIFNCCSQVKLDKIALSGPITPVELLKVQHLQKVLAKKRDPITHVCFLEELNQSRNTHLVQQFWTQVTALLTEEFIKAANGKSI